MSQPRVVWLGVEKGGNTLKALQADLAGYLGKVGFTLEKRAFVPHVTLARIKGTQAQQACRALRLPAIPEQVVLPVKDILLMQSRLLPQGVQYTVLHRIPLQS
ncbi:RNA 2',3'-cyclic phosphodiesterase [bacterium]|nr:RNA 2',3'-cyclic phosphodiesterase [bacterium]